MHSIATKTAIAIGHSYCDRTIGYYNQVLPLLTDSRIYEQKLVGHRYFVQLVSKDYELQDGYSVPKQTEIVDVVVVEPTEAAIRLLVASCGWLQGYQIVSYWQSEDGCEF